MMKLSTKQFERIWVRAERLNEHQVVLATLAVVEHQVRLEVKIGFRSNFGGETKSRNTNFALQSRPDVLLYQ